MKGGKRGDLHIAAARIDRKRKRKKKTGGKRKKGWSDLSEDIVSLILQRLTLVDRISFSLTCKSWRLSSSSTDSILQRKLPWIMEYSHTRTKPLVCLLYEPCHKWPYNQREASSPLSQMTMTPYVVKDEKTVDMFSGATLCASRFGWVLWSKTVYNGFKITYFYVYNPLSKNNMPLPRFKWQRKHRQLDLNIKYATFTSVPTSSDCEFIVVYMSYKTEIFLSSLSINGEPKWNTRNVTPSRQYFFSDSLMTYMKGMFYCFGEKGTLSSFNLATQEWSLLGEPWDWTLSRNRPYKLAYFLAYGGDLYLVEHGGIMDDSSSDDSSSDDSDDTDSSQYSHLWSYCGIHSPYCSNCKVYRFDWLDKTWKKMYTLGGGTIFLNRDRDSSWGSFGMSGEELGERTEQTRIAANRVYYFSSKFTPRFHVYGPQKNEPFDDRENRDMIYWDTPTQDDCNRRIWLEPPLSMPQEG